jgi:miniconductance mechanosensitive channel
MLVFKDTIVGLVAGVQLSANDMLRPGDWITVAKAGADGIVEEVTLTTIKIRNYDNTITTVPPYTLVSESFQNWRGMQQSEGRRIKRSLFINLQSIRFATLEEQQAWTEKGWMKAEEVKEGAINLTIFRTYLERYLRDLPLVNGEMTMMVRHLQPTAEGLPLELYFFSRNKNWIPFEHLQADVFDYVLAVLPSFGLRVYQRPSDEACTENQHLSFKKYE